MPRLIHRGQRVSRTHGDYPQARRERALASRWERENELHRLLESILAGLDDPDGLRIEGANGRVERPPHLTQRDATMVAEVVQWLGTNVGFSFLCGALSDSGYNVTAQDQDNARALQNQELRTRMQQLIEQLRARGETVDPPHRLVTQMSPLWPLLCRLNPSLEGARADTGVVLPVAVHEWLTTELEAQQAAATPRRTASEVIRGRRGAQDDLGPGPADADEDDPFGDDDAPDEPPLL